VNLVPSPSRGRWPERRALLDLRFLELDMLAHDGIIFAERQLFGLRARIFLGDVEKASVRRAGELDLDGGWLSHCPETF
jgi:hypothetical protein